MTIRVGDTVYRTEFIGEDVTTHPGVAGTVTKVTPSNSAGPNFAEVTFTLGAENTWHRTVSVDKLRVFTPAPPAPPAPPALKSGDTALWTSSYGKQFQVTIVGVHTEGGDVTVRLVSTGSLRVVPALDLEKEI